MSRPVFSFRPNMEIPDHKRAWEILQKVAEGQKNHFLVQAILKYQEADYLEGVIRRTVREELKCYVSEQITMQGETKIPDQMLDFLSQMEDGV